MHIYVQTLQGASAAQPFVDAANTLARGEPARIRVSYDAEGEGSKVFEDTIEPASKLIIAGAGHVGQALAILAVELNFDVTVIDDRQDMASERRFPRAKSRIVGEIEGELQRLPIDAMSYVVIVTRGHRHDGVALAAVIKSTAKYIGLIGSRRKVITIFQDLLAQGIEAEDLARVHAPIGLEIGAVTVPEIALSIAAELVAVRRGREGQGAREMRFERAALLELLKPR